MGRSMSQRLVGGGGWAPIIVIITALFVVAAATPTSSGGGRGDLFPLPILVRGVMKLGRVGVSLRNRSEAKSTRRSRGLDKHIDEVSQGLNCIVSARAGRPLWCESRPPGMSGLSPAHWAVRQRLGRHIRHIRDLGRPPGVAEQAGALSALLKSKDVYNLDRDSTRRPYSKEKVRVVRDGIRPRLLEGVLGPEAAEVMSDPEGLILKTDNEIGPELEGFRPYSDPVLRDPEVLKDLAVTLSRSEFIMYRRVKKCDIGLFTVAKQTACSGWL